MKDFIKVLLIVGACLIGVSLMYKLGGRADLPTNTTTTPLPDTTQQAPVPVFMNKPAKEGLREALSFYNIQHSDIVYAQAVLETGHFKSAGCLKHNNLFGLYDSKNKEYYRFNHWSESVIAYKRWIQNRYKPPEDYYAFLERIHYASDPKYTYKLKQIVNQK